jgi:hypothetical protein
MSELVYRFQVHFSAKRGDTRNAKFVADIRPHLHENLKPRLEAFIASSLEQFRPSPYTQREVFFELWKAWETQNKKLAAKLPAKFPDKLYALKKLRQKEHYNYSNPQVMIELWHAWCRQFPKNAAKMERRAKENAKNIGYNTGLRSTSRV